jgi:hopene-associated glycosyltransferase HpnB
VVWPAVIPLAIWAYLVLLHGRFWRTDVRLPAARDPERWPSVAVIVPARDEAAIIAGSLPTLLDQDYPGPVRVVLVDDRSADGTAEVARRLATAAASRVPLSVIGGEEPPPGWVGKLWALEQGVRSVSGALPPAAAPAPVPAAELSPVPAAELLLLTDADVAHDPSSLRRLVAWAEAAELEQVSLMARLQVATGWERLIIPAFVYFFSQLFPFRRVNRRRSRTAAAAGGCVLLRRTALERAGGLEAIRGAVIDDVALAGAVKRSGAPIWLGLADGVTSIRPYPTLRDLWDMVARSAYTQLRTSPVLLVGTLAGLALVYLGPVAVLVAGLVAVDVPVAAAGATATAIMVLTYVPMIRYYHLGWWRALGLPGAVCLYGAMTVSSAWRHRRGGVRWKGRRYQGPGAAPASGRAASGRAASGRAADHPPV